jgi:hypothetical protein
MPKFDREHLCACWDAAIFILVKQENIQLKFAAFGGQVHWVALLS